MMKFILREKVQTMSYIHEMSEWFNELKKLEQEEIKLHSDFSIFLSIISKVTNINWTPA